MNGRSIYESTKQTLYHYKYDECHCVYFDVYQISAAILPPYLTLDFSDVPALLATFLFGPVAGVIVELIKNLLNFLFNMGDPIGPVANFAAAVSFLLTAFYVSKLSKGKILLWV